MEEMLLKATTGARATQNGCQGNQLCLCSLETVPNSTRQVKFFAE
jgi:hypothetical protein